MIIKVKDNCTQLPDDETAKGNYELEVSDDVVIDAMTTKNPSYWYVLIDGKVFKSEQQKGLKSMLFSSREKAENTVKDGLYWKHKIIPHIGCNCGYDENDFYDKLKFSHKVEIKEFKFL